MTDFKYKTNAATEEAARENCIAFYKISRIFKGVEKGNKTVIIDTVDINNEGLYEITGTFEV